mmetsp:Transcript_1219/g.3539  ORF Transcript_1219/g.3539 Transcript_1219/m.3539 type:complete len:249 (-) Transcript_1219:210-956(-)
MSASFENRVFKMQNFDGTVTRMRLKGVRRTPSGNHFEGEFEDAMADDSVAPFPAPGMPPSLRPSLEPRNYKDSKATVLMKTGDLMKATEDYIAHQCSCISGEEGARGLTRMIFDRFPEANVYYSRPAPDVPGDVSVHGRVVNMYAQFAPGGPLRGTDDIGSSPHAGALGELQQGKADTAADRLHWFRQCLTTLPGKLPAGALSLAMPARIGCGSAGGNWDDYLGEIHRFAHEHPQIQVAIYEMEGGYY